MMERGGNTYFYHADHLGSIRAVTNAAGLAVNSYSYDAYGNFESRSETVTNPYAFTGREYDAESGLFYYRARYYDANTGRFTQEDPIGFGGGDRNLYRYVFNNPINSIDPTGLHHLAKPNSPPIYGTPANKKFVEGTIKIGEEIKDVVEDILSPQTLGSFAKDYCEMLLGGLGQMGGTVLANENASEDGEADNEEMFQKNAPKQVQPTGKKEVVKHEKYNPKTGELESVQESRDAHTSP